MWNKKLIGKCVHGKLKNFSAKNYNPHSNRVPMIYSKKSIAFYLF